MTKAGIITLYYNNNNYGGIAQAYALCTYLKSIGQDAELISYRKSPYSKNKYIDELKVSGLTHFINVHFEGLGKRIFSKLTSKFASLIGGKKLQNDLLLRKKAFAYSRDLIQHSQVYTESTIADCISKYKYFITGSDQVWKPGTVRGAYVFDFLPEGSEVFSYASSIAVTEYPDEYSSFMKENLKKYKWISVREDPAKDYLEKLLDRKVDVVVDPTLLLTREQWKDKCSARIINEPYMLAYFLGDDKKQHRALVKVAKERGLKLVTLPHLDGRPRLHDLNFGDIQLFNITLNDFLSLIQYADLVCTDSFHAVVFSYVFKTDFFVFDRSVTAKRFNMNSRIDTLLSLLSLETRKVTSDNILNKIKYHIDFSITPSALSEKIIFSKTKLDSMFQ